MEHYEINQGKKRNNDWKWKQEIDDELNYYQKKECECGCGKKLNPTRKQVIDARYKRTPLRFLKGHHNRSQDADKWMKYGKNHPMFGKKGKLSPGWKNGKSRKNKIAYGLGFLRNRRIALKRDNYICQHCGKTNIKEVHHIIPFRKFTSSQEANKLKNLITVCHPCHQVEEWRIRHNDKMG